MFWIPTSWVFDVKKKQICDILEKKIFIFSSWKLIFDVFKISKNSIFRRKKAKTFFKMSQKIFFVSKTHDVGIQNIRSSLFYTLVKKSYRYDNYIKSYPGPPPIKRILWGVNTFVASLRKIRAVCLKNSDFIYRSKTLILGVLRDKTRKYVEFHISIPFC